MNKVAKEGFCPECGGKLQIGHATTIQRCKPCNLRFYDRLKWNGLILFDIGRDIDDCDVYPAAQPEPPQDLREAVADLYRNNTMKRLLETVEYGKSNADQVKIDKRRKQQFTKAILAAVGPLVEARDDMIRRLVAMSKAADLVDSPCGILRERDGLIAEAQALIGGDDG